MSFPVLKKWFFKVGCSLKNLHLNCVWHFKKAVKEIQRDSFNV